MFAFVIAFCVIVGLAALACLAADAADWLGRFVDR